VISLVLRHPNFFKALRIFIEVLEHKASSISSVESIVLHERRGEL
jgi:hypothetical protein